MKLDNSIYTLQLEFNQSNQGCDTGNRIKKIHRFVAQKHIYDLKVCPMANMIWNDMISHLHTQFCTIYWLQSALSLGLRKNDILIETGL